MTIANGVASAAGQGSYGGGIYNSGSSTLNVYDVVLRDNYATVGGGAISNSGTLEMDTCDVHDNSAGSGGAVINYSQASIYDSQIYVNTATSHHGGGIYNSSLAQLIIANGSFVYSNTAAQAGGGIFNYGQISMSNSNLSTNEATAGYGGGLYSASSQTVTLTSVTLDRNKAPSQTNGKGGGIYVFSGTVSATTCAFTHNTAGVLGSGGAWATGATLTLTNPTITNNTFAEDQNPGPPF